MKPKIVFMGTPDFAVPSLEILHKNGFEIAGVVTSTDKLGGRGNKQLLQSPVKKYALEHNIPVLQPSKLKSPEFLAELQGLNANLQVVVAFRMLPEAVWNMPALGTFNLHGSLLPKYRGAAPINWAIINGDTETGVTTFFIKHEIDTGDVIFQEKMSIGPNKTAGEVHDRMMQLGAKVVLETVQAIESGSVQLKKQDETLVSKAPKIFRETCEIQFDQTASQVHNFIRGLSPYPGAWTLLDGVECKILKAAPEIIPTNLSPGSWSSDGKSFLKIACRDGFIQLLELQLQGRKRMDVKSFLNGYRMQI